MYAEFESQCVVEGTEVTFHCPNEEDWQINSRAVDGDAPINLTNGENGTRDYMVITAGPEYVEQYRNISLIHCVRRTTNQLFALLFVLGELDTQHVKCFSYNV